MYKIVQTRNVSECSVLTVCLVVVVIVIIILSSVLIMLSFLQSGWLLDGCLVVCHLECWCCV